MLRKDKFQAIFFVYTLFFFGCISESRLVDYYNKSKNNLPSELIDQFPESGNGTFYSTVFIEDNEYDVDGLFLTMKLSHSNRRRISSYAENNAKAVYSFTDPCLMMVNYKYKVLEDKKVKTRNCVKADLLPITNFEHLSHPSLPSDFFEKATIYVLDAKPVSYIDGGPVKHININLPDRWEHGYTKGVAIYGRYAVFWLEMW